MGGLFGSLCEAVRLTSTAKARRFSVDEEMRVPGTERLIGKYSK